MKKITVKLKSLSPMSQGRYHNTKKEDKENNADYERRTWREKLHYNKDGFVIITPGAIKNCLSEIAKFISVKIPGKGKSTYTKHFEAGVLVSNAFVTNVHKDDVEGMWLFVPSDGKRGGGKRVEKCFPKINEWEAGGDIFILDDTITNDVFEHHLVEAGKFIGLGSLRVRNNGWFGRFEVVSIKFNE